MEKNAFNETYTASVTPGVSENWSLLLNRMESAPFDSSGRDCVVRAASNAAFYQRLSPDDALRCVRVLQQHGLHDLSVDIMEWFNSEHPESRSMWREHLETLQLLGKRTALLSLRARAARHVPEEMLRCWIGPAPERVAQTESADPQENIDDSTDAVEQPFAELRRKEQDMVAYMNIFSGRYDTYARQWADRREQKQGYVPVRRPLTPNDIEEHLSGRKTYGIYLLEADSSVRTGVIDIDLAASYRESRKMREHRALIRREAEYLLKRIADIASEAGLRFLAEVSGGKGYHFWFPVSSPVNARDMRTCLNSVANQVKADVTCFSLEVFPKQDSLKGRRLGNLVKLPLGIHRVTGKPSWLLGAGGRDRDAQFQLIRSFKSSDPDAVRQFAAGQTSAEVIIHPRHAAWAAEYPELAALEVKCPVLGQVFAAIKASRTLGVREEKVLLGTLSHLPRGRLLLHHLFSSLPEYNRPLLDYRISRVRGTPLGCRRIHNLLDQPHADLPCRFGGDGYAHPLKHLKEYAEGTLEDMPVSEKVVNLEDALENLRTALRMVERFL